ncbi:hypothetical protein SERP0056 [Staphylococcus epidermidis RP62A]|uniref:Uncharacterized protein n=1 Tax=Staphylococcus epidermidis (strain ATCC 35984 / DSM 28319 / BCRC 17069 / CCUG 31568 / BM 3577 / RP62A) TaxID=176279 RepID=Q5HRY5_STAEQ|nr:hypothetical protein SERP0056 [Staphylococcus epidermidis RP62A]
MNCQNSEGMFQKDGVMKLTRISKTSPKKMLVQHLFWASKIM